MSTKIFYAYLYKKDAQFTDMAECINYMNELREKFITWSADHIKAYPKVNEMTTIDLAEAIMEQSKKQEIGYPLDLQLQAVIYPYQVDETNYIVIQFFPSRNTDMFIDDVVNKELKDFSYQNQTDDMFDLPDFEERDEFYDKVFEKYGTPTKCGLMCDIYNGDFIMADEIAMTLKKNLKKESENGTAV